MAEQPTTSLAGGGAALERDVQVATKFHVPRAGFVPRPRLLARLAEGIGRGLTVVSTPAGFGKTTVLGDWARRSRQSAAWLSLDAGDNDPARFWRYVAAALERVCPGIDAPVVALLRGLQRPPLEAVATAVINELTALPEEAGVVLVLDDYHVIEAPPVHESVAFLLDRLPPGLRLVLAGRADPPLPLARLRARGQLAELRAGDLRFTLAETAAFVREATGLDLPAGSVAALQDRTEGWAAGVQLAALSLRGQADPAGFIAAFAGSHRYVLDYLTEEVLARQPEPVLGFLLETSVLERLCGPLCDAVTGRTGSQAVLEELDRANLFMVPLDEERHWWRYHHLFADLLRARLQRERPQRIPGLHRRTAAWHEQYGFADDAVRHAMAAGEAGWAARLVERHVEALLRRREDATLDRWLSALPAVLVRARPRLCLAQAFAAIAGGRLEAVEPLVADAERAFAAAGDEPHEPSVGRALSVLANLPAAIAFLRAVLAGLRGDPAGVAACDQEALTHLGEEDWQLRSLVAWSLATADWMRGRLTQAEDALAAVVAERQAAGEGYLAKRVCYHLGQVQHAQGRLGTALRTYRQGLIVGKADQPPSFAGMAHVGVAEVLYERDELADAHEHAARGITLCRQLGYTQQLATGLALLARIRQAQGDAAGALDAIGQAERVTLSPQIAALHNPVPAWRARLLLASGEVSAAARWASGRGLEADDEPGYPREPEYLALARVMLAEHAPGRALGLLDRLHATAAAQQRTGSVIELGALRAIALAARGDQASALASLAEAVALAAPAGYVRVFADEGAPMAQLLGRLAEAQRAGLVVFPGAVPPAYLARLMRACQPPPPAGAAPPAARDTAAIAGLAEPLSGRELEVLRLLAAGRSNQQIADELVVSLATVKKHVGHILGKLTAANRTQAVARARVLGLLP